MSLKSDPWTLGTLEQHTSKILTPHTISYMKRVTHTFHTEKLPAGDRTHLAKFIKCCVGRCLQFPHSTLRKGSMEVPRKCELCGKAIPAERMKALPETKRCVECAQKNGSDIVAKRTDIGMDIDTYKDLLGAIRS